jgi:hypothetical protein
MAMEGGLTQKMAGDYEMVGHGSKFGRKKEEAIAALLTQRNVEEAAKVAGIGTNTLWRWMRLPELQAAYRKARRDAFSQSVARLQQASTAAVSTLLEIMVDRNAPETRKPLPVCSNLPQGKAVWDCQGGGRD